MAYHSTFYSFQIFSDMFEPIILLTGMMSTYERCRGSARQPSHFCSGKSSQNPVTPSLATSQRADARLRRAAQLAVLGQGLPVNKSIRPRGQAAGVIGNAYSGYKLEFQNTVSHCLLNNERSIKAHLMVDHVILSETKDLAETWLFKLGTDSSTLCLGGEFIEPDVRSRWSQSLMRTLNRELLEAWLAEII